VRGGGGCRVGHSVSMTTHASKPSRHGGHLIPALAVHSTAFLTRATWPVAQSRVERAQTTRLQIGHLANTALQVSLQRCCPRANSAKVPTYANACQRSPPMHRPIPRQRRAGELQILPRGAVLGGTGTGRSSRGTGGELRRCERVGAEVAEWVTVCR
jgi:hypothetical protein